MTKLTMTRGEFEQFWSEVLGNDWFLEYDGIPDTVRDSKDVDTLLEFDESAVISWQGPELQTNRWINDLRRVPTFFTLVQRWRSAQSSVTAIAEIPVEKLDEFRRMVAYLGGKVTSPAG